MMRLPHLNSPRFRIIAIVLVILFGCGSTGSIIASVDATTTTLTPTQTTTWTKLESSYPAAEFEDVKFINSSLGWIVGILYPDITSGGVILYTEDGGDSWETKLTDDTQIFRQIDVVNEQTIWVTGLGCLYFTNDTGESWYSFPVGESGLSGMSTVKFFNETHGWTATMHVLYKTNDSGQTWQSVPGWNFNDNPRDMHFLTEYDVWAIGYNGIYHSEDGAETWERVFNAGGWSLSFPEENVAWGVSDDFLFHMKPDQTWEALTVPGRLPSFRLRPPYCTDIQFIDDQNGWIVGTEIAVMHTPDGGSTWYQQSVPAGASSRMIAVCFVDISHGWVVGSNGCILRTTAGNNLDAILFSGQQDLQMIAIGAAGIVITIIVCGFVFRRRKKRMSITQPEIE